MKLRNIASYLVALLVVVSACEPIEDRDTLNNSYNPDDIQLEVIQSSSGTGNGLTLKMNTTGVYGYWDYKLNKKFTNEVEFISPFMGNVEFDYYVATPIINNNDPSDREYIKKSIVVDIQVADNELAPEYYSLVGDDLGGKTWVFDRANPLWWYMSPNDGNAEGLWWNAAECCAPSDQGGKMVFDLSGAANYTYYSDASGEATGTGTFRFNDGYDKFYIDGDVNILGAEGTPDVNDCAKSVSTLGEFQIYELTSDRLVLYIPDASCSSGWTWVFVPEA